MAAASTPIDPDAILNHSFETVRRGYDPLAVQKYLMALAGDLRLSRDAQRELERRVADAERRAAELEDLSPSRLTSLLGEETMRVLDAANAAASDIRANAEESVARLLREAQDQASELRRESEAVLAKKTAEATAAAEIIGQEIEVLRQQARIEAAAEVEAGRQEGRDMVTEAQRVRERMLRDLARRRKAMRQQIDQLQAGRDRLMAAYDVVRETLDVATGELEVALPEAKAAAEAAQRAGDEERGEETLDQDFAELAVELDEIELAAGSDGPDPDAADGGPITQQVDVVVLDEADDEVETTEAEVVEIEVESEPAVEGEAEAESETTEAEISDAEITRAAGEADEVEPVVAEPPEPELVDEPESVEPESTEPEAAEPDVPEPVAVGEAPPVVKADSIFARIKNQVMLPESADDEVDAPAGDTPVTEAAANEDVLAESPAVESAPVATDEPTDPDDSLLARRDAAVADLEKNLARRVKRELSDEQNELLDTVRRGENAADADALLPTPEAHVERYASVATVILTDAVAAGVAFAGNTSRRAIRPSVSDIAEELAAELIAPLRDRLARGFSASDGDTDEISERVRACFREWKTQRVDGATSHAVLAAFNRGLYEAVAARAKIHWIVDDGDTASPDCEDNALAGNLVKGEAFPTGHLTPPAHPTCRCLVVLADS